MLGPNLICKYYTKVQVYNIYNRKNLYRMGLSYIAIFERPEPNLINASAGPLALSAYKDPSRYHLQLHNLQLSMRYLQL